MSWGRSISRGLDLAVILGCLLLLMAGVTPATAQTATTLPLDDFENGIPLGFPEG